MDEGTYAAEGGFMTNAGRQADLCQAFRAWAGDNHEEFAARMVYVVSVGQGDVRSFVAGRVADVPIM